MLRIHYVLGVEALRIAFPEQAFPVCPGRIHQGVPREQEVVFLGIQHGPEIRQEIRVHLVPDFRVCDEEDAV